MRSSAGVRSGGALRKRLRVQRGSAEQRRIRRIITCRKSTKIKKARVTNGRN